MKKLSLFLCLIILGCNSIFGQAVATVHRTMPVDSAARVAQFKRNIENFTNALKQTKDDKSLGGIHMLLGVNEAALKQFSKAISDFSLALKLNPDLKDCYIYRATSYEAIKDYASAIVDYEKVLTFITNNPKSSALLYTTIGRLQLRLRQFDRAIKSDSTAISLNPLIGEAYANRAWAYVSIGKNELAILDFTTAMGGYENNRKLLSGLFLGRADAKIRLKKYKDAINDYSTVIELIPDNKSAILQRAACYYYNGDYQLADDDYNKMIIYYKNDNKKLARLYDDRSVMEMGLLQCQKAITDDSLAISLDNQLGTAYWHKADAYAQNADFQLSIDNYIKTMSFYQNEKTAMAVLYNNIANEEYFLNEYQKVIDASTSSILQDEKSWSPYLNRGRAYLKKKNNDLAMSDFNKVLVLDTTKKSFEYAFALFYTGSPDKAINVMQSNLLSTTNDYVLMSHYYNLACLFSLMNKPDDANIYLKKCIDGGYPKKYALNDPDLDNIRNTQEYKDNTR
jgi:tetratricopeptide (TPR) repeat protein